MDKVDELREYLARVDPGSVVGSAELKRLLATAWDAFEGSDVGAMAGDKLLTRELEDAAWEPPELSFTIERHGGAAQGSSRAERQRWVLDLARRTASMDSVGWRQLSPSQPPFSKEDAARLAEEVVRHVLARADHPALEWKPDGRVRIVVSAIIPPDLPKQTLQGRRKRLREVLAARMVKAGWQEASSWVYGRDQTRTDAAET